MRVSTKLMFNTFLLYVISIATLSSCQGQSTNQKREDSGTCSNTLQQEQKKDGQQTMDTVFERAVAGYGMDYLRAEGELRNGGPTAIATLRKNLNHSDPIGRLLAKSLLNWMEGNAPDNQAALDYLDNLPARLEKTPIGNPSPLGAASYLTKHFKSRVAEFLALRLVKQTDWPQWRVGAILFYLEEHKLSSTTEALIRFAAETNNEEWRKYAIQAIKAIGDIDLKKKVMVERQRQEKQGQSFPATLAILEKS